MKILESLTALFTRTGQRDYMIGTLVAAIHDRSSGAVDRIVKASEPLIGYMEAHSNDCLPDKVLENIVGQYRAAGATAGQGAELALKLIQPLADADIMGFSKMPLLRELSGSLIQNIIEDISEARMVSDEMARPSSGGVAMWIEHCTEIKNSDIRAETSEALLKFCEDNREELEMFAVVSAIEFAKNNMRSCLKSEARDRMENLAEWVISQSCDPWNYASEKTVRDMKILVLESRQGAADREKYLRKLTRSVMVSGRT